LPHEQLHEKLDRIQNETAGLRRISDRPDRKHGTEKGTGLSRLTELIARAKASNPTLAEELDQEFRARAQRRAFGRNFERHRPESVELPARPVRRDG
jgi:hypothetical protein